MFLRLDRRLSYLNLDHCNATDWTCSVAYSLISIGSPQQTHCQIFCVSWKTGVCQWWLIFTLKAFKTTHLNCNSFARIFLWSDHDYGKKSPCPNNTSVYRLRCINNFRAKLRHHRFASCHDNLWQWIDIGIKDVDDRVIKNNTVAS